MLYIVFIGVPRMAMSTERRLVDIAKPMSDMSKQ